MRTNSASEVADQGVESRKERGEMSENKGRGERPRGLLRRFLRTPVWLYRAGLGWLLGNRFLMLRHRGRKSGLVRYAVLEVAGHHPSTGAYLVASGWGKRSDWYQNVLQDPSVTIQVGRKRLEAMAVALSAEESGQAMVEYARSHPKAARNLMRTLGIAADGTEEGYRRAGTDEIPFVSLVPR